MTLIKTLRFNNGAALADNNSLESPSIQVQPDRSPSTPSLASTRLNKILPAYQQISDTTVYIPEFGHYAREELSVENMCHWLWRPPPQPPTVVPTPCLPPYYGEIIIPPLQTEVNVIIPEYSPPGPPAVNMQSAMIASYYDNSPVVLSGRKFETYEQITGIIQDRPEIVMMANFLPLFNAAATSNPTFIEKVEDSGFNPYMTNAGRYVDTYIQSRNLRYVDVVNLIRNLRASYPFVKATCKQQKFYIERSIAKLKSQIDFLFELVRNLDRMKMKLNMRDDIHTVVPLDVMRSFLLNFNSSSRTSLEKIANNYMPAKFTLDEMLVRLGYDAKNTPIFTSSKVWIMLLIELRDILQYSSAEFMDSPMFGLRTGTDATSIDRGSVNSMYYFGYYNSYGSQPLFNNVVPPLNAFNGLDPVQVGTIIDSISQAWVNIYQTTHFNNDDSKVAGIANLVAKEIGYSSGLSDPEVVRVLKDQYGYDVVPIGNQGMFDAIIGKIGYNITQFPQTQTDALTNLAQRQDGDKSILTFESKYIDGMMGTAIPGGVYYVDQVLKTDGQSFDTTRLEQLAGLFENSYKSFSTIVNGLGILGAPAGSGNDVKTRFSSVLSNPLDLIQEFAQNFIDTRTGETIKSVYVDRLAAIYHLASGPNQTSRDVRAALFLYTMTNIIKPKTSVATMLIDADNNGFIDSTDNSAFNSEIIKYIVDAVERSTLQTYTPSAAYNDVNASFDPNIDSDGDGIIDGVQYAPPTLTNQSIESALKSGTNLTKIIESMMTKVLEALHFQDKVLIDQEHTRINGYLDTAFLMMVFDMFLLMAGRYAGQVITSVSYGTTEQTKGTLTYNIGITSRNWSLSYGTITGKLEKEAALTHQCVYSVLNTLQKLSESLKSGVNYLKSQGMVEKLREISTIIDNPQMMNMLFSEQQIMILSSVVQEMTDRISQQSTPPQNSAADGDGDIDAEDELKLLDDALITPAVKNAALGLFNTPDFVSKKGGNKKILTVGIPHGFIKRLKDRTNTFRLNQSKVSSKQNDIVSIVVYKVDIQNPDLVFKSKRMLFEMSRFPVKNDARFLSIPEKPSPIDIYKAIPTRDFGQGQTNDVSYWSDGGDGPIRGAKPTFGDSSYSFLPQADRLDIVKNHVTSYLADIYIRLMTGVNVGEDNFTMFDLPRSMNNEMARLIVEHYVDFAVNVAGGEKSGGESAPTGGVLFSTTAIRKAGFVPGSDALSDNFTLDPTGIAGFVSQVSQFAAAKGAPTIGTLDAQSEIGTLAENLKLVNDRNKSVITHGLRVISNLAHMNTTVSDPGSIQQRALAPRQFDRVFNIVIDPNDFEIDNVIMTQTPNGAETFNQLIQVGNILPLGCTYDPYMGCYGATFDQYLNPIGRPFVQNRIEQPVQTYKAPEKNRVEGDIILEKYFITVETYDESDDGPMTPPPAPPRTYAECGLPPSMLPYSPCGYR